LRLEVSAGAEQNEQEKIAEERAQAISEYLVSKWQLAAERINITSGTATERAITLKLQMAAPTQ
jgi:hypothetical protein